MTNKPTNPDVQRRVVEAMKYDLGERWGAWVCGGQITEDFFYKYIGFDDLEAAVRQADDIFRAKGIEDVVKDDRLTRDLAARKGEANG